MFSFNVSNCFTDDSLIAVYNLQHIYHIRGLKLNHIIHIAILAMSSLSRFCQLLCSFAEVRSPVLHSLALYRPLLPLAPAGHNTSPPVLRPAQASPSYQYCDCGSESNVSKGTATVF